MTDDLNTLLAEGDKPEQFDDSIKRDRYGNYLLPHPETGEMLSWTRASSMARTIADNYALEKWMQRNLVLGLGRREDLYARAASVADISETEALTEIVQSAFEAAGSSSGSNLGTAMHRFTERIDMGERVEVPEKWRADIDAYCDKMAEYGIGVLDHFTERVLLIEELGTAGTCDRILTHPAWSKPRIGDLKTGKNVKRNMDEIAVQLAIYAHASHWFDPRTNELHEMPEVDQEVAVVMHLPIGAGRCELLEVDIASGWESAQTALSIRQYRKRKDLCWPMTKWEPEVPEIAAPPAENPPSLQVESEDLLARRHAWVKARAQAIKAAGHIEDLRDLWNQACADIAGFKAGGPTSHEEIDRVAGICNLVESKHQMPFHDGDPAKTKPNPYIEGTTNEQLTIH